MKKKRTYKFWTKEEMDFLKKNYKKLNYKKLSKILGRKCKAMLSKAYSMGLNENIFERMKNNNPMSNPEIYKKQYEVSKSQNPNRYWQDEEIDFLKENYGKMDYKELIKKFKKSVKRIRTKANSLGLKKESFRYWTKKEEKILQKNYKKLTQKNLSRILGRSCKAIGIKAYHLGLSENKREYMKHSQINHTKVWGFSRRSSNLNHLVKPRSFKRAYAKLVETLEKTNHLSTRWFLWQDSDILIQRNTRLKAKLQQLKHPIIASSISTIILSGYQNTENVSLMER